MTRGDVPPDPSVLDTTARSKVSYVDRTDLLSALAGICTVPAVREELAAGVEDHPYLRSALNALDESIPVAPITDTVANPEMVVREHLDPGEAQAFALADARDGRLLTDDGDARTFAREHGVTVTGSVGVSLAAIDAGRIDEATADEWLERWIDDTGYYVPSRDIEEYR